MNKFTIKTHFKDTELNCRCGCGKTVTDVLLLRLECLRSMLGIPLTINSGARCHAWNETSGGARGSKHLDGIAVDIACSSDSIRNQILEMAPHLGFFGIGLAKNYIHLDLRAEFDRAAWFY